MREMLLSMEGKEDRDTMEYGEHVVERPARWRSWVTALLTLLVCLLLFWGIRTFIMQPYQIPSGSMEETVMTGDSLFSERVSYYFDTPQRGDIITFADPEIPSRVLLKRVIATGGETVSLVNGRVLVDGVAIDEPYAVGPTYPLTPARNVELRYPYTVPEGELWVMGDNRENSQDSRYFGAIPENTVTGKAFFVYWPLSRIGFLGSN